MHDDFIYWNSLLESRLVLPIVLAKNDGPRIFVSMIEIYKRFKLNLPKCWQRKVEQVAETSNGLWLMSRQSDYCITYLWMQCALERTQNLFISTPPHQWPMKPSEGCKSSSDACQPNSPSRVGKPNMILGFLVVDVARVVVLLFRFLDFAATAVANQVEVKRERNINSRITA